MFKTQNFCHIASNNRNQVKAGVFVYRTTDDLATVSASGYFNARIIDINLHDLIIHEKINAADATKVERNVLCVTERTLENVGVTVIKSKWEEDIEGDIEELDGKIAALKTYVQQNFVNIDGSSIMTGPLKMRSGSMQGAIAPYWNGIGLFKLGSNNNVTLLASMDDSYGFIPANTNTYNLGSSTYKWKDAYVGRVITSVLNNGANINVPTTSGTMALTSNIKNGTLTITQGGQTKGTFSANQSSNTTIDIDAANVDLSNLSNTGKNISNWSSNVTNCITEISQDINLELNNGALTLKSGSKVYIPNGASNFDIITIANDMSITPNYGTQSNIFVFLNSAHTGLTLEGGSHCYSGNTAPTLSGITYANWYDTANNIMKRTTNGGNSWLTSLSLPIAIITSTNNVITSIDQVFNGFGYIGSTVFALPGVKGLIPNGRNTDGTLNNTSFTISSVLTNTITSTYSSLQDIRISGSSLQTGGLAYDEIYNYNRLASSGTIRTFATAGYITTTSGGTITSFSTKYAFRAVNYSDSEYIANCAMPSDRYVDLTLGATLSNYTAPADGYVTFVKVSGAGNEVLVLSNITAYGVSNTVFSYENNQWLRASIPVSKGDVFTAEYTASGDTKAFRFVYANGSK